jgi:lipid II:glycine glycyltransferase (peptidoglycan interpeptide bridge formation enzyme)
LGTFIKLQRPENLSPELIKKIEKIYHPRWLLVEPKNTDENLLLKTAFKQISPYIPSKTMEIDLSSSKWAIFESFKKDARYSIRKSAHCEILEINNVYEFRKLWKSAVSWKKYIPPISHLKALKLAFKDHILWLISPELKSGACFLLANNKAYYWYGFTGKNGRKSLVQYAIVWQGIQWAKSKTARVFDMEGIYDDRFPNKGWIGFSHFKKSFGGKIIEYPGAYVKWSTKFGRGKPEPQ